MDQALFGRGKKDLLCRGEQVAQLLLRAAVRQVRDVQYLRRAVDVFGVQRPVPVALGQVWEQGRA